MHRLLLPLLLLLLVAAPSVRAQPIQMPRVISRGGSASDALAREPGRPVACVSVSAPNDRSGALADRARVAVSNRLQADTLVRPGFASCDYQIRLTLVENLDGQQRVLSHTLVADVALALRGSGEARGIAAMADDASAAAGTRRTARQMAEQGDAWERYLGTTVQIAGRTPLAQALIELTDRLASMFIAPSEASIDRSR